MSWRLAIAGTVAAILLLVGGLVRARDRADARLVEKIETDLRSPDAKVRMEALASLYAEAVRQARGTKDRGDAVAIARSLVEPFKAEILKAASDENVGLRSVGAMLLQFVHSDDQVIAALVRLAAEEDRNVRRPAIGSLAAVGQDSPDARRLVLSWLQDISNAQQFEEGAYLAREWRMKEAVPALRQGLQACDPGTKQRAAIALGAIGGDAVDAIPSLQQQLGELKLATSAIANAIERIKKARQASATPSVPRVGQTPGSSDDKP